MVRERVKVYVISDMNIHVAIVADEVVVNPTKLRLDSIPWLRDRIQVGRQAFNSCVSIPVPRNLQPAMGGQACVYSRPNSTLSHHHGLEGVWTILVCCWSEP